VFLHFRSEILRVTCSELDGTNTDEFKLWIKPALDKDRPQESEAEVALRKLASSRAVWCWYEATNESAAMWDRYANAGVAISCTLEHLKGALEQTELEFLIARMDYRFSRECPGQALQSEPHGRDKYLVLRPYLNKDVSYKSENEIRVVTYCDEKMPGQPIRFQDPLALMNTVVISPRIHKSEADDLKGLIEEIMEKKKPGCTRLPSNTDARSFVPAMESKPKIQVKPSYLSGPGRDEYFKNPYEMERFDDGGKVARDKDLENGKTPPKSVRRLWDQL